RGGPGRGNGTHRLVFSPEGAVQVSPGREPWVGEPAITQAPKWRYSPRSVGGCVAPSGLGSVRRCDPGLTPWAMMCRPFGAEKPHAPRFPAAGQPPAGSP